MSTPDKCPLCGCGPYTGTSHYARLECRTMLWDDGTVRLQSPQCITNQLAAKLAALESAYAECAEKLHRAEQREHHFKRRLADVTKRRDRLEQRVSELELRAQGRDESRDIIMDAELASLRGFVERMENKP